MSRIIRIEELGFPKSMILREDQEASELIYGCMLVDELNAQLEQDALSVSGYKSIISEMEEELSNAVNAAGEQEQRAREAESELRNILHEMRRGVL